MTKLRELIERPALTAEEHEPISAAAGRMFEHSVGSVCVLGADGSLTGIFTERDLLRACAAGVDTHAATLKRWMTTDPVVAHDHDEAAAALQVMIDKGFRHLPVLGEGGLTGVVSMRDLSREIQSHRMG